jgi:glutamyl-tRNA synthetase
VAPIGPRLRFAPSPTGYLHVGSARTALFNWLEARRLGGSFILRIEDTDEQRNREEWVEPICSGLSWLGLDWDEGPYRQSQRGQLYRDAASSLASAGRAYFCDCTRDQIDARARERGGPPGYDGFCRDRGLGPGPGRALRFRVPDEGTTVVHDLIRGEVAVSNATIEDFVVVRSDGVPLFVLANAVDDADMGVTHVVRGEEHLPTTPKYLLVWRALGAGREPSFAHLPLLVNERRQKLSKRRDPVALERYQKEGYLPEAMVNYLALLGWGPSDGREMLSLDELVAEFRLEEVNHSPAAFDPVKLLHFNGMYLRAMSPDAFVAASLPFLEHGPWPKEAFDQERFARIAPLVQERVSTLAEVPASVDFLFLDRPEIDPAAWEKAVAGDPAAATILAAAEEAYGSAAWEAPVLHRATEEVAGSVGRRLARAQAPIRVAVTGRTVGPPLFESLQLLGRDQVLARLDDALSRLRPPPPGEPAPGDGAAG